MLRNFRHMLGYCRPYRRRYLAGAVALLAVNVCDAFTPKLVQWGIDHLDRATRGLPALDPVAGAFPSSWFGPGAWLGGMWLYGALFILVAAFTSLFRYSMFMGFFEGGIRLVHDLRGRLFAHLQRLEAAYHDRTKVGDHMSLATNDTDACRMFYVIGILILLDTIFYFVLVPAFMVSISWKLTLACIIPLPLIPFIVAKLTHTVEDRFEKLQAQFAALSERARESFAGAKVVQSFVREESEKRSFARHCREYYRRGMRFAKVYALEHPLLILMLGLADLVVVAYGGSLVLTREISIGGFTAFFQYLIRLSGPMIGLGWTVMLYQRARVSMGRIEAVMEVEPGIREPAKPVDVAGIRGRIMFRGVTWAYPGASGPALRDVSFEVPEGDTLGIVGPVGSGKSTILRLIPRLYEPPPGGVFVDGHDVRALPLGLLRGSIGAVPQETFLFSDTIRSNILLGTGDDGGQAELVTACARTARVEEDILGFPDGYESMLGERGVNLSGGQQQRVAIARALARRPRILLLDDCLSSVDTETESAILSGLRREMGRATTVIVSHRVSAVRDAGEILVLDQGRVVERGNHEALLSRGGRYAELHEKQRLEKTPGEGGPAS